MKKILVSLVAMMFLFAGSAFGLSFTVNDDYYLGYISSGLPASETQEALFVNNLIKTGLYGEDAVLDGTQFEQYYSPYVINISSSFPEATTEGFVKIDGNPTGGNLLGGFTYLLGKFGNSGGRDGIQSSHVWYVGGLLGDFTVQTPVTFIYDGKEFTSGGLSHITLFNPTAQVPEPATLLLFGAGIAGLAVYRRRRS